jgi:hypothetical protein
VVQDTEDDVLDRPIKEGDFIEVEVTPTDGFNEGKPILHVVHVGNAPPTVSLVSQNISSDGQYEARLKASDPEKDSVEFSLKNGPPGMTVDLEEGVIRWSVQPKTEGDFGVEVSVKDSTGFETMLSYQVQISWQTPQKEENNETAGKPASQ